MNSGSTVEATLTVVQNCQVSCRCTPSSLFRSISKWSMRHCLSTHRLCAWWSYRSRHNRRRRNSAGVRNNALDVIYCPINMQRVDQRRICAQARHMKYVQSILCTNRCATWKAHRQRYITARGCVSQRYAVRFNASEISVNKLQRHSETL